MAIINTSPDSFSGDGLGSGAHVTERIRIAVSEGADILDIGGQSTRPGAHEITASEEIARVVPAIQSAKALTDLPISVDTYKPAVAEAALRAGADIINDVRGLQDREMQEIVLRHRASAVIMHSRGTPKTMQSLIEYDKGVVEFLVSYFSEHIQRLRDRGLDTSKLWIDPGIGFAKTSDQNWEIMRHLNKLVSLGPLVVLGASRKNFLGEALQTAGRDVPAARRDHATCATTVFAILGGAAVVRVHNVDAAFQVRTVAERMNLGIPSALSIESGVAA